MGTLLLDEGIAVMSGNASGLATGEDVDILFPGMPEGGARAVPEEAIDLTVDAQVLPKHAGDHRLAQAARAVVKPAKGRGSTLSGHGSFTIPATG